MSFNELLGILNGEYKEIAGTSAKNQCVDLANTYIKYVLRLPIVEFANAKDFPIKVAQQGNNYNWILNSPTNVPKEGDLVIWDGVYGHIAIFIEGDANKFISFDENFPTGSPCHIQEHDYKNVIGWLHPKNSAVITQPIAQPEGGDQVNREQLIIDAYKALTGEYPTDDEKRYRLEHWTNTSDFLSSLTGDGRFQAKFTQTITNTIEVTVEPTFSNPLATTIYNLIKSYRI